MPSTIRKLLIAITLLLSVSAYAAITVRGIAEVGDTPTTTATVTTVGALAGDSIIVVQATQGAGCPITNITWSSGTATATTSGTGCISLATNTQICLGDTNPLGYAGCYSTNGSSSTTVTFPVASNPGTFSSSGGFTILGLTPVDNASNTYVEVTGFRNYVNLQMWVASNIALHSGGQPTVTCSLANSNFTGVTCGTWAVGGLGNPVVVDQVKADFSQGLSNITNITTPSIGGNFTPELIIAFSAIANVTGNATFAACGHTFTNYNTGNNDGIGGYPPAYLITSGLSTYCAGLIDNAPGQAWPSIASFKGAGATGTLPDYAIGKSFAQGKSYAQ